MRWTIVTDDDGHDYLIPADKRDEFESWIYPEEIDAWGYPVIGPQPPWAITIGGAISYALTFENPTLWDERVQYDEIQA